MQTNQTDNSSVLCPICYEDLFVGIKSNDINNDTSSSKNKQGRQESSDKSILYILKKCGHIFHKACINHPTIIRKEVNFVECPCCRTTNTGFITVDLKKILGQVSVFTNKNDEDFIASILEIVFDHLSGDLQNKKLTEREIQNYFIKISDITPTDIKRIFNIINAGNFNVVSDEDSAEKMRKIFSAANMIHLRKLKFCLKIYEYCMKFVKGQQLSNKPGFLRRTRYDHLGESSTQQQPTLQHGLGYGTFAQPTSSQLEGGGFGHGPVIANLPEIGNVQEPPTPWLDRLGKLGMILFFVICLVIFFGMLFKSVYDKNHPHGHDHDNPPIWG